MAVKIIAEVAQGYEGNVEQAKLLAKASILSNADCVKFQSIYADELATPYYKHYKLFKKLEMTKDEWKSVVDMVHASGKEFYFDVFGDIGLETAIYCGADGVKIHTTDFFNCDLTDKVVEKFKNILVSVGGIEIDEIRGFFYKYRQYLDKFYLMFGYQTEPTPIEYNNINRIHSLREEFPYIKFGFMDHSEHRLRESKTLSLCVLSLGMDCLEKHITLDHLLELEDSISALTPNDFKNFVEDVRNYELAMGSASLKLSDEELKYRKNVIKVAVASKNIAKGSKIEKDDVCLKRVNNNFSSYYYFKSYIVGKTAKKDICENEILNDENLE